MTLMSRNPVRAICKERGIGVALIDKTLISALNIFNFSFLIPEFFPFPFKILAQAYLLYSAISIRSIRSFRARLSKAF